MAKLMKHRLQAYPPTQPSLSLSLSLSESKVYAYSGISGISMHQGSLREKLLIKHTHTCMFTHTHTHTHTHRLTPHSIKDAELFEGQPNDLLYLFFKELNVNVCVGAYLCVCLCACEHLRICVRASTVQTFMRVCKVHTLKYICHIHYVHISLPHATPSGK